jgi:heterodisulfide reductase subunit A
MADPEEATLKAECLLHMAIAKVTMVEPLAVASLEVTPSAVVVGGGLAGMTAALAIADQGFKVVLVEKQKRLGGNLNKLRYTFEEPDVRAYRDELVSRVERHRRIKLMVGTRLGEVSGYVGNFESTLKTGREQRNVKHGVVILATGGTESKPEEYRYPDDSRVITQSQIEEKLARGRPLAGVKSVVMIQCVGSREEGHMYCSRLCCGTAVKNAIRIRETSPETEVYVLYRDMRTYGLSEEYYQAARDKGVVFVRFEPEAKPEVANGGALTVTVREPLLERDLVLRPDLVVLSSRIDACTDNEAIGKMIKVPLNEDGFFLEAHAKLRPVEFATEGVFVAGLAHAPKPMAETIAQAEAAAAKACTIISKDRYAAEPTIAALNEDLCDGCGICVPVCEYNALEIIDRPGGEPGEKIVRLSEALCKGCGGCVAACPSGAMEQKGFKNDQMLAMIQAALAD